MRVGIIGTGFGRRVVAPVVGATDGCTVVDVVSARDAAAVTALVARSDVDLVSVHSPPFLHARHVRLALERRKPVLCDKPLGISAAEAATLRSEAEAAGVLHLVNFEFRYHPARRLVRRLARDGTLGRVEHVSWVHLSSGTRVPLRRYGWLFDRTRGGGWIGAWASHAVDTLRFCFGEVTGAVGFPRTDIVERPDETGRVRRCTAEDGLVASLVVDGTVTVAIDSSFAASTTLAPRLTVLGSGGALEVVADERATRRGPDGTRTEIPLDLGSEGRDRHDLPMRRWIEVVRDAVRDGAPPHDAPTFADGHACAVVLDLLRDGEVEQP